MLSPPKWIPTKLLLHKTTTCLTQPATTCFRLPNEKCLSKTITKKLYLAKKCEARIRNNAEKLNVSICLYLLFYYSLMQRLFKVGVSPSKKKNIVCINDSPSKMLKNAFYFILKALFVLKIFKFLSWLSGHVEKTTWLERSD